ncbi:MAG: c-type cytochrome [Vicingaceae bacterium]|nr:c-type cytochrome [Vicingaceae bacterium]
MKKVTLNVLTVTLMFGLATIVACGSSEEAKETAKEAVKEATEIVEEVKEEITEATISGEQVFTSKGCVACHQLENKTVGPSLKDIATAYDGNKEGLIAFLKEEGEAIVDPAQAAVMQPQLAVTKALPADELEAITDYMLSKK